MFGDECFIARFATGLHGLQPEPGEGFTEYRRPAIDGGLRSGEGNVERLILQSFVEGDHFAVIEVERAYGREDGERILVRDRVDIPRREDYSGSARAVLGKFCGEAGAAGKSGEIDAALVDGQAGVSVLKNGLDGLA